MTIATPDNARKFETLVEQYYSKVLFHSLKKVRDLQSAEEITQETFLKAFANLKNLRDAESFGPWIFRICHNEISQSGRSHLKNLKISDSLRESAGPESASAALPSPLREKLYSAFPLLGADHREIIALKYFCGFGSRQIAALTGMEEKLIKSRLYEARSKLAALMRGDAGSTVLREIFEKRRNGIMDKVKLMENGAYIFSRLSLKTQFELLGLSKTNEKFSEPILLEIGAIERGREFVRECDGRLNFEEITLIISYCDEETIKRIRWEQGDALDRAGIDIAKALKKHSLNGYIVNDVAVMLSAGSVEKTLAWYEKTLGWKGHRGMFAEDGTCCYGCVTLDDREPITSGTRGFHGFHITHGAAPERSRGILPIITVDGLDRLEKVVKKSGWEKHSGIIDEDWGSRSLTVTDVNGYELKFIEWPAGIKNPYKDEQ